MKTMTKSNTPGFNSHLFISFKVNKHGKECAYYQSGLMRRLIRMSLNDAKCFVAEGLATEVPTK